MAPRVQSAEAFAAELLRVAAEAPAAAAVAVTASAKRIQAAARANVRQSAPVHNAGAARAITYDDPTVTALGASTEVGYDKDRRGGSLGNLLEYGGGGDRSPAHRDLGRAADAEEDVFAAGFARAAGKLL